MSTLNCYYVTNGYLAESEICLYVLAYTVTEALQLAEGEFKKQSDEYPGGGYESTYWTNLKISLQVEDIKRPCIIGGIS